jgi:nucleoside-diphosphate-sugar epimerase
VGTRLARHLARDLAQNGAARGPVLALVRRAASAEGLAAAGIPARCVDLDAPALALEDLGPVDAVAYLAPPDGQGEADLRLTRFLAALGDGRPRVLLYMSTTGVYGDTGGAVVDEASPTAPGDARSRQRLDAERQAARWCGERGARCVILRAPAIYGPHRLPLDRLQRGEPVLRAEDSGPGNRIHVDDLVAACLAALDRPVTGVFNLTDGQPEPLAAFMRRLARLAGLPAPAEVAWAEAQGRISPGLLAFLRQSRRVASRRAADLGWSPALDPEAGLRASLREMGLETQ